MPFTLPADVLKHTLIIASFREPVQRVVSLYFHRVRYDWVRRGSIGTNSLRPGWAGARRKANEMLCWMQGGAYRQPFSDFISTFHTQDEYAKLLGGDACCFHPAAYESDEASCFGYASYPAAALHRVLLRINLRHRSCRCTTAPKVKNKCACAPPTHSLLSLLRMQDVVEAAWQNFEGIVGAVVLQEHLGKSLQVITYPDSLRQ